MNLSLVSFASLVINDPLVSHVSFVINYHGLLSLYISVMNEHANACIILCREVEID